MKIKPGRLDKTLTARFLSVSKSSSAFALTANHTHNPAVIILTVLFSFYAELNVVVVLYSLGPVIDVLTLDIGLEEKGDEERRLENRSNVGKRAANVVAF